MNRYSGNIKTDWLLLLKDNAAKLKTDYTGWGNLFALPVYKFAVVLPL
jgi:hypothetical protein